MKTEREWFDWLDALQESGTTNMFGAPQKMVSRGLDRLEARRIWDNWVMWVEAGRPERGE